MHQGAKGAITSRLRTERQRRGWSQQQLADLVGATLNTVSRWELGSTMPNAHFRARLCAVFSLSSAELGFPPLETPLHQIPPQPGVNGQTALASPPPPSASLWHVPVRRNPFFIGRQEILLRLHQRLSSQETPARLPQALGGLGGIGKTHLAAEYAYHYRAVYQAVFWLRAETHETLLPDLSAIARLLSLSDAGERDQRRLIAAVKAWLGQNSGWLLILDNIEDLTVMADLLPADLTGAALLTTRNPITGTLAQSLVLEGLAAEEGALFLLRRAKRIAPDAPLEEATTAERALAAQLVSLLDGLPLALDQAGAYLEETGCSLADYLERYRTQQAPFLHRRGGDGADHPASVAATLSLAIKQLEQTCPAAVELLHLCAFLHPDALPEEVFPQGAEFMGALLQPVAAEPLALDAVMSALLRASLVQRNADLQTFSIHHLLQVILRDQMPPALQRCWAERAIQVINRVFPGINEEVNWPQCQRMLPQAQACALLIEQMGLQSLEAGQLLTKLGAYLSDAGHHSQAETLLSQAQAILLATVGERHPAIADCWNDRGDLCARLGRLVQAQTLFQQALTLRQALFDASHPAVQESLHNLGMLYLRQGKYAQAEPLLQRVLALREAQLGAQHPKVARVLHNLAGLAYEQGEYARAEALFQQVLSLRQQSLGAVHLHTLITMTCLANAHAKQGKYAQAEALHQHTLEIREQLLGPTHAVVATNLNSLAQIRQEQGQYEQADALYQRALTIRQQALGATHPSTLETLNDLTKLFLEQGQYEQAEKIGCQALTLREQTLGPAHPVVAESLATLACLYSCRGDDQQAASLWQRACAIWEETFGPKHAQMVAHWEGYRQRLCERRRPRSARSEPIRNAPFQGEEAKKQVSRQTLLSIREQEVLALLAQGKSNYEIASELVVEVSTIKWYLKQLYSKLHAHNRTQAVAQARAWQLLE